MNEEEFEIKEKINVIKNTVINLLKIDLKEYKDDIYMLDTEETEAIFKLLDKYETLKEIEEQHRKENGLLRVELEDAKEQLKNFYEGELYTAKQLKNLDEGKKKYYIHKDKIKTILGADTDSEEALLSLLETIIDENARLENIEDKKVQIEYDNVFNKGAKSVKDKIRNKIKWYEEACEHLSSNGTDLDRYDQYQGAIEALQSLLEE